MSSFQDFVNTELPLRPTLLRSGQTTVNYDGIPNLVAAPPVIQLSPPGTLYLQESTDTFWQRDTTDWKIIGTGGGVVTTGDMTIPMDAATGIAVPEGAVLSNQEAVDAALDGASGFLHIDEVWNALPIIIQNPVVLNFSAGIFRPSVNGSSGYSYVLTRKQLIDLPGIFPVTFQGQAPANYTQIVAPAPILLSSSAGSSPQITCAPGTFPNDESLIGHYAVGSNGYASVIHDHTDTTLFVGEDSSLPVGPDTIFVGQPSTIIASNTDDATNVSGLFVSSNSYRPGALLFALNDLRMENPSPGSRTQDDFRAVSVFLTRCQYDAESMITRVPTASPFSTAIVGVDSDLRVLECGFRGNGSGGKITSNAIFTTRCDASIVQRNVFKDVTRSAISFDAAFGVTVYSNSAIDCGDASNPVILFSNGEYYMPDPNGQEIVSRIIRAGGAGLLLRNTTIQDFGRDNWTTYFQDCVGPCVVFDGNVNFDITPTVSSERGLRDLGGNLDVGIEVTKAFNAVFLSVLDDVTGANGDLRIDGVIQAYADLPLTSSNLSRIVKAT